MYITFRSMEGKKRALQAYNVNTFKRVFSEVFCGMAPMLKKKKLLMHGWYKTEDAESPDSIIWENIGVPFISKTSRGLKALLISVFLFMLSLTGVYFMGRAEKQRINYVKKDCSDPDTPTDIFAAQLDFELPWDQQNGLLNCYCLDIYQKYGWASLKVLFPDGEKHCQEWFPVYTF